MSIANVFARLRATALGLLLSLTIGPTIAQVMIVPLPVGTPQAGAQVVLGSLSFNTIIEPTDTNVIVYTNSRTATNSVGASVSSAARVSDIVLTNGGMTQCYLQIANLQGDLLLAEVAVPPSSTVVINLFNPIAILTNNAVRIVRSDLFGPICNGRLAITMRGFYSYTH
jgi:hypothetical protein